MFIIVLIIFFINNLKTKYSEVKNVSFSYNKELLCTVGVEEKNKESIIVW
jgi:hypothetical protein